ncbi:cell division protein ZapA [Pseudohaliea rubra]|uniref:Cell division protein ZapA n=1 Tax=Pseudohaliea rubra DSM 19751 TaxID=1265313 RepID=A0A095VRX8_9GAMM|nr:cell division protein ZapA [Pseudohaliea rubra]KGE04100.1 Z-ring-associated protein ZapA [Pseudohaliea rubra DSM 19751]
MAPHTVSVTILDKDYQVACPEDQAADLVSAASYLDKQMRAIRDSGKVIGLERIAVMAALNISYDLQRTGRGEDVMGELPKDGSADGTLRSLNRKLDEALHQLRQIEIS